MIVMHPLPRGGEISPDFDDDPALPIFVKWNTGCM
jgi:aspartate carbamoyltransferase catalytic subunit